MSFEGNKSLFRISSDPSIKLDDMIKHENVARPAETESALKLSSASTIHVRQILVLVLQAK